MQPGQLVLSWRTVAYGSMLMAISALATLSIIATVNKADTLSTIALALAILAFVIQILVFVAQSWADNQQMVHAEALNSDTKSLLAELRTSTHGTHEIIRGQFDRLLDNVLGRAREVLKEDRAGSNELTPELSSASAGPLERILSTTSTQNLFGASDEAIARANVLRLYPEEDDGMRALEILRTLSRLAAAGLKEFVQDEERSLQLGLAPGLRIRRGGTPWSQELIDTGLLQASEKTPDGRTLWGLSDKGRLVGRILNGRGEIPDWLLSSLPI